MSGLLMKHSSGLVVRSFQHLRTAASTRIPALSESLWLWPFSPSVKSQFRTFSANPTFYDKAAANVSIEQNEDVVRIRERDARKEERTEQVAEPKETSFTGKLDPEDDLNDLRARSTDEVSTEYNEHGDSDEPARCVTEAAAVTDTKSKPKQKQPDDSPGSIIYRLRKLSMTDISRYSKAEADNEPPKSPPPRNFDQRLLKVLAVRNKLKSRGGRDFDDYGNYDDYDRPKHNRRGGGMYDDYDEPSRGRPTQRYSNRSPPSYNDHQRGRSRLEYDDDEEEEDEEEIDFDPSRSRRNVKSDSSRLREQAQIRRGMDSRRAHASDEDDEEYEEIVRNRFVTRQKNPSHSSRKGENFD